MPNIARFCWLINWITGVLELYFTNHEEKYPVFVAFARNWLYMRLNGNLSFGPAYGCT